MSTNRNNPAATFVNRANFTAERFARGGIGYDAAADLLLGYLERIAAISPAILTDRRRATAIERVFNILEDLQAMEPSFEVPLVVRMAAPLGDGCYVTLPATIDY